MFTVLGKALLATLLTAGATTETPYWVKIKATDKFERSAIANTGVSIEVIEDGYVVAMTNEEELQMLRQQFEVLTAFKDTTILDFPEYDSNFHNYAELNQALGQLQNDNPELVRISSIGQTIEGREIPLVTIGRRDNELEKAGVVVMGGHHAREHLSIEIPLMLAQKLVAEYRAGDDRVKGYLDNRMIYIIPMVNPDGAEFDIATGQYRSWRKNRRRNSNGTFGVDLNRNYDYKWGTVGISHNPSSDTYCGTGPFSEPETQALKTFIESKSNLTTVLSLHTFSKLILYPWGHTYDKISESKDHQVHETMAKKMATWNGYVPQQGSDLYLVSGDTGDWVYGTKGLVTFTFELDPRSMFEGGFYPGQSLIQPVFDKNWGPLLYLIEYSDNPYRVLEPSHSAYGLSSALVR